ncbi:RHS repeat domain-containing protein [Streptomyces sp. NPDC016566]|uniref:RHS repeat domain-containing protein n=1 Tax=Streptomyces sp. NPDC016566 TaxID=3364967 RepID=UPI0036FA0BB1
MAEDPPTETLATDLAAQAETVQESYTRYGATARTVERVRRFVTDYLEQTQVSLAPVSSEQASLTQDIEGFFGFQDPVLHALIQQQIEDIAAGRQTGSTTPPQACVAKGADPVEMFRGEFQLEVTDVTILGAGLEFVFRRSYKNRAVSFGPLGAGWDHSLHLGIREAGTDLIRTSGELRDDLYTRHPLYGQAGFDYWVPPDGRHGVIEAVDTSFAWRAPNGTRYFYERTAADQTYHRIRRIEDRFGNYLGMRFDEELLTAVEINHPARHVTFSYDPAQRLTGIRDHTGRVWTYGYDDLGDLVSVTTPATDRYPQGLTTRYEYSSADYAAADGPAGLRHNLVRIIDPAGNMYLENEYGQDPGVTSFNRVVRQRQGRGQYLFEYQDIVNEFEFDYDPAERPAIQVNQFLRDGHPVHFVYNTFGNLIFREEYLLRDGVSRLVQWRYRYNRDGSLTAVLSPEGCVEQHYYGRDDFLAEHGISDEDVPADPRLTASRRMAFGNLLATVRRHSTFTLETMNTARGVWGDLFPDVVAAFDPRDLVTKYTYEPRCQQVLTVSDPRTTERADPRHAEPPEYTSHLTRYEYSAPPEALLTAIHHPDTTFPSPLPSGETGLTGISEQFLDYDARGRLRRYADPGGNVSRNEYVQGRPGDPTSGYLQATTIDADALALTTRYTVNALGIRTEVRNPRGVATTYAVNALDQITERTSGGPGLRTRYFHDRNGQVERQERDNLDDQGAPSPEGDEVTTYRYDDQNNLVATGTGGPDPASRHVTRYRYDAADCRVATIRPLGDVERYAYEERRLPRSTTRGANGPQASTTRIRYDGDGRVTVRTDGRGNRTVYRYDAFGRVVATTDALGGVEQTRYDKAGHVVLRRFFEPAANGGHRLLSRSAAEFDERGNRVRQLDFLFREPIGTADIEGAPEAEFLAAQAAGLVTTHVTQFFLDANKRVFRTVDPRGHETTWAYDGAGRCVRSADHLGNTVRSSYDENSNLVRVDRHEQVRDPVTGAVLREDVFSRLHTYDLLDRPVTAVDGLGNLTAFTYDSRGNQVSVTDPLGNVRRFVFDVHNRRRREVRTRTSTGRAGGAPLPDIVTEYLYDDNDRLTAVIDPAGNKTEFGYDDLGRRWWTRCADGTRSRVTYDADDHAVLRVDNNGLALVSRFDRLGRLLRLDLDTTGSAQPYPADADCFEEFAYDGLGRPTGRTNDFCAISTRFDSLGRAVEDTLRFTVTIAAPPGPLVIGREFDELARRTSLTYPSGRSIRYAYDELNRTQRITNEALGADYPGSAGLPGRHPIAEFRYRGLRRATVTYGNQCTVDYAYDGAGRCVGQQHSAAGAAFLELQQLFDGVGNRRLDLMAPPATGLPGGRVYTFDSLAQLTSSAPAPLIPFDATEFAPGDAPQQAADLNGQQRIDTAIAQLIQGAASPTSYEYDSAGNRLAMREPGQPPLLYTANALNQYTDAGGSAPAYDLNGNLVADGALRYRYNYRNQLVGVRDEMTGADLTRLRYDAVGRLIAVQEDGPPTVLVNDGLQVVEEYEGPVPVRQYVNDDGVDRHVQIATGAEEWWCHRDILGSLRQLTDAQGAASAQQFVYDPFGRPQGNWVANAPTPYLFTGKRHLATARLYHSMARQYSPALGRFLQRDPQGFVDGPNLYQYVGNNPVGWVDPLGTDRSPAAAADTPGRELGAVTAGRGRDTMWALSKEEMSLRETEQILRLDMDPDEAFPETPEARWPYALAYHAKHRVYRPLADLFSDITGVGREQVKFIGPGGQVREWTGRRDHTDALDALGEIGSFFLPTKAPNLAGAMVVEEAVGVATAKLVPEAAGALLPKMAQTPSEVFGVLARFRDEEVAAMRSLYPEFLGPGRVDPALAIGGANKGTWFGNILNERVRRRVETSIAEGALTPQLQWTRQGQRGVDFWLPETGTGYDLFPARGDYLLRHEASYVGQAAPDGTLIQELMALLYIR